jgi:hypothetical protein
MSAPLLPESVLEDTSGRGHTHRDLSPVIQALVVLND